MLGIELFAGAGGMSLGATAAGVDVKFAVEFKRSACETYAINHPHGRRLAAILRLADELSENPRRADEIALKKPHTPAESFLPNFYCKVVASHIDLSAGQISLKYLIDRADLDAQHPDPEDNNEPTFVVDYIARRIGKCDQERRYCNRFLNDFVLLDRMRASLEIHEGAKSIDEVAVDTLVFMYHYERQSSGSQSSDD